VKAEKLALWAASLLQDKKAGDPAILDLKKLTTMCDFFVLCHGTSDTHVRGLADYLEEEFKKKHLLAGTVEGYREAEWVLIDLGDVIVHIFSEAAREFYDLERLWGDAPHLEVPSA
jgi:ribosome-associated protein